MKKTMIVILIAVLVTSLLAVTVSAQDAGGCCPAPTVTNPTGGVKESSGTMLAPPQTGNETAQENTGEYVGNERVEAQKNRANITPVPTSVEIPQTLENEGAETTQEPVGMERVESQLNRTRAQTTSGSSGTIPEREIHYVNGTGLTATELLATIAQQERNANESFAGLSSELREVRMRNTATTVAIGSIIAAGESAGSSSTQIIQLAREINSSLDTSRQLEQQIAHDNSFFKFFTGGNSAVAKKLQQEISQNQARMSDLQALINGGGLAPEVSSVLNQQILALNTEDNRLLSLAQIELANKGLFGGLFGW